MFFQVLKWLYYSGAKFGVGHIELQGVLYWMDSQTDMDILYNIFKTENK